MIVGMLTTRQAAEYLGFAEDTVRRYIKRGIIRATKTGPIWLVDKRECDRYRRNKNSRGRPKNPH